MYFPPPLASQWPLPVSLDIMCSVYLLLHVNIFTIATVISILAVFFLHWLKQAVMWWITFHIHADNFFALIRRRWRGSIRRLGLDQTFSNLIGWYQPYIIEDSTRDQISFELWSKRLKAFNEPLPGQMLFMTNVLQNKWSPSPHWRIYKCQDGTSKRFMRWHCSR